MGILTTQDSGRAFSTYVALFGLALLISSSMYLKRLNHWAETNTCVKTVPESGKFNSDILCSNYKMWRTAAIIGVIIGVVDVLVVPFLLCCSCCIVCGCTALLCCCVDCSSSNESSGNATELQPSTTTPITSGEATTPTTNDPPSKFNLSHLPKPVIKIINILGWAVWVFLPFIGTLLITIWLYKTDGVRTSDDKLYGSALSVFVCALLNLMVYYQKFIDSVCQKVCGRISQKEKERRGSAGSAV